MKTRPLVLLGIDVEDPRHELGDGGRYKPRVPALVDRFLAYLDTQGAKATFFIVGQVAREHPDMVGRIVAEGHEVGCHSDRHLRLETQDAASFRADLLRALEALDIAGATEVRGYRAPCFSLGPRTCWAYDILAELGFRYSSSVLPAANPRYGWSGFGRVPRRMASSLWELPVTLLPRPLPPLPLVGGVYFRNLPTWLLSTALSRRRRDTEPVVAYLHPYDADVEQDRLAHAGLRASGFYNWLMYRNRAKVFPRLDIVARQGFAFAPLGPFAQELEQLHAVR
jgi:polysaccharide deacetylase family protein (PEP-CTERM system associated)